MSQRTLTILTAINFVILAWLLVGPHVVSASSPPGVLRGSALEIVDNEGRVRASLGILPAEGDAGEETVLLRLINAEGQPSVKIGVSTNVSAMSLVGGDDESYIVIEADGPVSNVKFVSADGATRTIAP